MRTLITASLTHELAGQVAEAAKTAELSESAFVRKVLKESVNNSKKTIKAHKHEDHNSNTD